ncbi:MAG: DUF2851 family protein [Prolixibacteraceae bacterium]|nr:DUF2851 family protein [Prolixibacteraceae bacterium]
MTEEFLQYIWKYSLYSNEKMFTADGDSIEVINQGEWNKDSGPDFFNASIKIGDTLWAGNVEVHLKSSDWFIHGHHNDKAYNNVILHVVLDNDADIKQENREVIPVFIPHIREETIEKYNNLINKKEWPSCSENTKEINRIYLLSELDTLAIERIIYKTGQINKLLEDNKNNWEEAFYQHLARSFGFQANSLPFEMTVRSLPSNIVAKHRNNLFQLEALFFGQSGLLNEQLLGDDYFLKLREEYSFLRAKYELRGIEGHIWKFMRMRPINFPTIRLAQFASLMAKSESLLSEILKTKELSDIIQLFDVKASDYWDTHYHFNNTSRKSVKHLGESAIHILLINTVVPFIFIYGEKNGKNNLKQRAIDILSNLPPESNNIITGWAEAGIEAQHAFDSQALIHLKKNYCDKKKCLYCRIGMRVICSLG